MAGSVMVSENPVGSALHLCTVRVPTRLPALWRQRVSAAELAYCEDFARVGEHVAARVAAKRAVAAALQWPGALPWRAIEIVRTPPRAPEVLLSGVAEQWQRRTGSPVPRVSISHAAGYAAAVAWLPGVLPDDLPDVPPVVLPGGPDSRADR